MTYTDDALDLFDPLLVQLVHSGARDSMLRGEGFRVDEIRIVRGLVTLSDQEELDAGQDAARDARSTVATAPTGEAVTALSGQT